MTVRPYGLARALGHAAWITFAALLLVAVTIYAVTGHPMVHSGVGAVIDGVGGWGSIGLAAAALIARFWRSTTRGNVRVADGALSVVREDGKVVETIAREKLRNGWITPSGVASVPPGVSFETSGGTRIEAKAESIDAAKSMLRDLGLDAKHKRYDTILGSRAVSAVGGVMASSLALGMIPALGTRPGSFANVFLVAMIILVGFVTAQSLAPRTLTIGTDGLSIRGLMRSRFISFAEIDRVDVRKNGLAIHYKGGRFELIGSIGSIADIEVLQRRIVEAMNETAEPGSAAEALDALERQGRPFATWRASIAEWANSIGSLRGAGIATETLLDLLKDASAPAVKRIGAAIALMARGDAHREQLRVVAESSAEPHVRVALERVLEGESLSEREVEALEESSHVAGA